MHNTLSYLINTLFYVYTMIVLMRFWLQLVRADFYNPLSQFVVKATNRVIAPLRRIIPGWGGFDLATLLFAYLLVVLKFVLLQQIAGGFSMAMLPGSLLLGLLGLLKQAGYLLFWVLILRAILSWVSQGRSPIEYVLAQLSEPLMAPLRRIIPPIGGLDLSILILIVVMQLINSMMYDFLGSLWALL